MARQQNIRRRRNRVDDEYPNYDQMFENMTRSFYFTETFPTDIINDLKRKNERLIQLLNERDLRTSMMLAQDVEKNFFYRTTQVQTYPIESINNQAAPTINTVNDIWGLILKSTLSQPERKKLMDDFFIVSMDKTYDTNLSRFLSERGIGVFDPNTIKHLMILAYMDTFSKLKHFLQEQYTRAKEFLEENVNHVIAFSLIPAKWLRDIIDCYTQNITNGPDEMFLRNKVYQSESNGIGEQHIFYAPDLDYHLSKFASCLGTIPFRPKTNFLPSAFYTDVQIFIHWACAGYEKIDYDDFVQHEIKWFEPNNLHLIVEAIRWAANVVYSSYQSISLQNVEIRGLKRIVIMESKSSGNILQVPNEIVEVLIPYIIDNHSLYKEDKKRMYMKYDRCRDSVLGRLINFDIRAYNQLEKIRQAKLTLVPPQAFCLKTHARLVINDLDSIRNFDI